MSINAEVTKTGNESAIATIRKFSRRVQGTGLVKTVRAGRYYSRDASKIVKKKHALKVLKRRNEYKQLVKEGKIIEAPARRPSYSRDTTSGPAPRLGQSSEGQGTPISR